MASYTAPFTAPFTISVAALLAALACALLAACPPAARAAQPAGHVPLTLLGVTLGQDISNYAELVDLDDAGPVRDAPFITEADLRPGALPGIRGGSLTYGNCAMPGAVLRLKLKFEDRSQKLYKDLLARYEAAFGKPRTWLGDPFNVVSAWEWTFQDGDREVRLVLMHSSDPEERPGVSIKMTLQSLWNKEYQCWHQAHAKPAAKSAPMLGLDAYLPR
ncbi:MAG: hypothetical protein AB7D51_11675 [Desulfovibrionaceae bacterium]